MRCVDQLNPQPAIDNLLASSQTKSAFRATGDSALCPVRVFLFMCVSIIGAFFICQEDLNFLGKTSVTRYASLE